MRSDKVLWGAIGVLLTTVVVLSVLLARSESRLPEGVEPVTPSVPTESSGQQKLVAIVGTRTITEEQLNQRLVDRYGAELLRQMLDWEAIREEASEVGVVVSRAEIEKELDRMQRGYESKDAFYRSMKEHLGMSKEELQEDVYYKLLLERLVTRGVSVPSTEIDRYIAEHPEEFQDYIQYHLLRAEVKTKAEAESIIKDVRNGADFASLAGMLSLDPEDRKAKGDMGWLESDDPFVPAPILQAAEKLKVGDVSKQPIALENSYAVILLLEKKEVKKVLDPDARERIRIELALQKGPSMNEYMKTLRQKWEAEILVPELR